MVLKRASKRNSLRRNSLRHKSLKKKSVRRRTTKNKSLRRTYGGLQLSANAAEFYPQSMKRVEANKEVNNNISFNSISKNINKQRSEYLENQKENDKSFNSMIKNINNFRISNN
jgi:hypothetical protein